MSMSGVSVLPLLKLKT